MRAPRHITNEPPYPYKGIDGVPSPCVDSGVGCVLQQKRPAPYKGVGTSQLTTGTVPERFRAECPAAFAFLYEAGVTLNPVGVTPACAGVPRPTASWDADTRPGRPLGREISLGL